MNSISSLSRLASEGLRPKAPSWSLKPLLDLGYPLQLISAGTAPVTLKPFAFVLPLPRELFAGLVPLLLVVLKVPSPAVLSDFSAQSLQRAPC